MNTSSPSSRRFFFNSKTWLLGENSVHFLTLGQISNCLLPFISYQFGAFFSYFYTLKHENFVRIRKHWWHLRAELAFINTKCMKMGYNRIYQASNTCNVCFGRVSCTALIPAPQASFMVQFSVVAGRLHRDGIIMVSCGVFMAFT